MSRKASPALKKGQGPDSGSARYFFEVQEKLLSLILLSYIRVSFDVLLPLFLYFIKTARQLIVEYYIFSELSSFSPSKALSEISHNICQPQKTQRSRAADGSGSLLSLLIFFTNLSDALFCLIIHRICNNQILPDSSEYMNRQPRSMLPK